MAHPQGPPPGAGGGRLKLQLGRTRHFFQGDKQLLPWERSLRRGLRDKITREHLLASIAIPFVFPAVRTLLGGGGVSSHAADIKGSALLRPP